MRARVPDSEGPSQIRRLCLLLLAAAGLYLAGPAAVPASTSLEPPNYPTVLGRLYDEPSTLGPWRPGAPLLRLRPPRQPLLESQTPFAAKSVRIDSAGAHYQPLTAGFADGAAVTLPLESYVERSHRHAYGSAWHETVRRGFQRDAAQQARGGRGRLEWRVPFPAPTPIRRFIGDEGSLRITGSHTASIGGKSQWTAGEVQTLAGRPSKFPTLSMDQQSNFAVEGSVGEAINLRITQDTESLGSALGSNLQDQLANQIKLDYKGDEDDIFQEVQAGNTTLSLPNTRFVGFNQQHKGLFGIRAKGHLGPLAFTTIASHEKSESNRQTFRGGAQVDTVEIKDYQYIRNQWYFLGDVYRERLADFAELNSGIPSDFDADDRIDEQTLQVFVNDFNVNNDAEQLARPGTARVDPAGPVDGRTGYSEVGTWHRLDPDNDYALVGELGYIVLRTPVQDRHALAVAYRTAGGVQVGAVPAAPDSLRLKLVKARDSRPEFPTWDLEWKNVYRIVQGYSRGKVFDEDKIRVEVLREVPGTEPENTQGGKSFLQLMGLDTHGQDPGTRPDQIIDADYVGLDGSLGVLIFPDLRPFAPAHPKYQSLETAVPEIYDRQQQRDQIEASRYIIQVINSSGQQRISLAQGRLASIDVESVDVILNGKRLIRGSDYNVSFTGEVQFLGEVADKVSDPGADLEITYESQDVLGFGSQQKTLLGMRGEYEFLDGDGVVGSTMIYNNVRSPDRRVRVGAEPARTIVWDMDLRAKFAAPFLTRAVDALPLLKTAAPSDVQVQAEVAQSRPNLNTKGEGFIDDFEGAERPEAISVFRSRWTQASFPEALGVTRQERGPMIWYNPFDRILRTEIWPGQEDQIEASNNKTDILVLELATGGRPSWNGVMTTFTGGVRDFSQSKFLEVWLRGERGRLSLDLGDLSEDVIENRAIDTEDEPLPGRATGDGQIAESEDVGLDRRTDEAEFDFYILQEPDVLPADLEGLSFEEKRNRYGDRLRARGREPTDPEGDNWDYDPTRNRGDYRRINGTQGNRNSEGGQRPDTEDLNDDGNLNDGGDFYRYSIDLTSQDHVPGTLSHGWRLFRIPLLKLSADDGAAGVRVDSVGLPDASRIEYARLVFQADATAGDTAKVEIAQVEIIGNEWQEDAVVDLADSTAVADGAVAFDVTVIGTDEVVSYRPPPGVRGQQLTTSRVREREQSLVLDLEGLEAGYQASATKVLSRNADYTKYTRLRMFVHGDSSATYVSELDSSDLELFVRFGADSLNYYEYSTAVFPGWDERNEVEMDLLAMASVKARLQSAPLDATGRRPAVLDTVIRDDHVRAGAPATYRVRGNPSMQQVKQLSLGVRNRSGRGLPFTGQLYADELRLDDARNDPGLAAYARVSTQLADFMDLDANVDWRAENFRTIANTERRSSDLSSSLATSTNLHKLLPGSWGIAVPVKVTVSRDLSLPRFGPNSDVELGPAEKDSLRSQQSKQYAEISFSKRGGRLWLTRWSLDQMNLRLSQTRNRGQSPVEAVNDADARTLSFSYKAPLPKPALAYLGWLPEFVPKSLRESELTPMPTAADYGLNVDQQSSTRWRAAAAGENALYGGRVYAVEARATASDSVLLLTDTVPLRVARRDVVFVANGVEQESFDLRETYATKASPLRSLSVDYSLGIDRDLRRKYDPGKLAFGREIGRTQQADVKIQLRLVRWLDPSFSFQANYDENSDPRRRRQSAVLDSTTGRPIRTLDITSKNSLSARVNMRLPDVLKAIGAPGAKGRRPAPRPKAAAAADADEAVGERAPAPTPAPAPPAPPSAADGDEPFILRRLFHASADYLEPISYSWRRNTEARSFDLVARPRLEYQLGLSDSLMVEQRGVGLTQQDSWNGTTNTEASSGLRLPLGFSVKPAYKDQVARRSGSTQNRLRVERSRSYPDLTVAWGRADRLPLLRRYLTSAQVNLHLTETESQQAEGSLDPANRIREGTSREWRISWTGQWQVGPTTRLEVGRSASEDRDYELSDPSDSTYAPDRKPPLRGIGQTEKRTVNFETRYKLRARALPFFGKLKSHVDLKFNFDVDGQVRNSATGDEELVPISSTDRWEARFTATYSFSENFRGEGVIRVENDRNNISDRTRMVREIRASGTLFFN